MVNREGMATADNDRFLRMWYEVDINNAYFNATDLLNAFYTGKKWFPYNKGGEYRKWYGNNDYLVNWYLDGKEIKSNIDSLTKRVRSHNYNGEYSFQEGLTQSALFSADFSLRYSPKGYLFDSKGVKGFVNNVNELWYIAGLLNSRVAKHYLSYLAPTIDYKVGDIIQIPLLIDKIECIITLVVKSIDISKDDYDSCETSWDFKKHPLI